MKLQSIFVSYLLLPIISILLTLVLIIFNKGNALAETKKLIFCILGFSLLLALPGFLTFTDINFIPLYYSIVQILYFFIGFFYQQQVDALFDQSNQLFSKSMTVLVTIIVFCLGSYLFSI